MDTQVGRGVRVSWDKWLRVVGTRNQAWARGPGRAEPWCPTGFGMVSRCTDAHDSVCRPCDQGFYNEAANYGDCKPCTQCNQSELPPAPTTFTGGSQGPRSHRANPKPQWACSLRLGVPRGTSLLPVG